MVHFLLIGVAAIAVAPFLPAIFGIISGLVAAIFAVVAVFLSLLACICTLGVAYFYDKILNNYRSWKNQRVVHSELRKIAKTLRTF